MNRTLADARRWVSEGTALVRRALAEVGTDEGLSAPSGLPGWTRKHLLAHVAANADAIGNLVHWAATGERTPMYASVEQRNADIEAGATRPASELLEWFERSAAALESGFDGLDESQWAAEVVTAQGRTVPASETAWMRAREVLVHAVDLAAGVGFADLPADFLVALEADIRGRRAAASHDVPEVSGPHAEVVAWLAGRPHRGVVTAGGDAAPTLSAWL